MALRPHLGALVAAALGLGLLVVPPASAAPGDPGEPTTYAGLKAELAGCTGTAAAPYSVVLAADLDVDPSSADSGLATSCVVTVDLAGHSLFSPNLDIGAGGVVTIADSIGDGYFNAGANQGVAVTGDGGLVVASGSVVASGGGHDTALELGSLAVSGGELLAQGGQDGIVVSGPLAISGGELDVETGYLGQAISAQAMTVSGGDVIAHSSVGAAGTDVTSLSMSGGTLLTTGGTSGEGIAATGPVTLSGGVVSAMSGGADAGETTAPSDVASASLAVTDDGVLRLGTQLIVPHSDAAGPDVTISGKGLITSMDPDSPARIVGSPDSTGQVRNDGRIWLPTGNVEVPVLGRDYAVSFDTAGGRPMIVDPVTVFAGSFVNAGPDRAFPASPSRPGLVFVGWATPGGTLVTATTHLSDLASATGGPAPLDLVADFQRVPVISGETRVGQTLGEQHPEDAGGYQWYRVTRDGTHPIAAAHGPTYRLRAADLGDQLLLAYTRGPGRTTATSATVTPGRLTAPGRPAIQVTPPGRPHVGDLLHATTRGPAFVTGLTRTIVWHAGGDRVGGDRPRLRLSPALAGRRILVVVTYSAPGYSPLTVRSTPTRTVTG